MGADTRIEWCDHTFNPWYGCQRVSPGCDHCYAEGWAKRSGLVHWGPAAERRRSSPAYWRQPLRWNEAAKRAGVRARVFCASLADVFDRAVPPAWRADLFALIAMTPHLDWLVLTKRIGNAAEMIAAARLCEGEDVFYHDPIRNIWLGATVVNQAEADRDIPKLLATPAAKRFLSIEPMLGPVELDRIQVQTFPMAAGYIDALRGHRFLESAYTGGGRPLADDPPDMPTLNWVICGGESGRGARPMHPDWVRSLRDQCARSSVPFLFKQWGEWTDGQNVDVHVGVVQTASFINGQWYYYCEDLASCDGHRDDEPDSYRIGKRLAGRLLDGTLHHNFPASPL
ncbi:MAG: phage Gp37/Gp68 family protein [Rhodocyclaceae bacterium]|nr:phage Gp37/Gp68 family protein [Rhodocyclaceae bacterium]